MSQARTFRHDVPAPGQRSSAFSSRSHPSVRPATPERTNMWSVPLRFLFAPASVATSPPPRGRGGPRCEGGRILPTEPKAG
jgi:hypothetical protein